MAKNMNRLHLGIDIGTTSMKICLKSGPETVTSSRRSHDAYYRTFVSREHQSASLFREQDPMVLLATLDACMADLKLPLVNQQITSVSVTGQMHGIVLWKTKVVEQKTIEHFTDIFRSCVDNNSNLITWEDLRCDQNFLDSLPKSQTSRPVATGYGMATLLWLHRHQKWCSTTMPYDMCGSIMDFLVWLLTQREQVQMTPHNANSLGYFDESKMDWDFDTLQQEDNFSCSILPRIVPVGHCVGKSAFSCYGITKDNTIVYGGLGDMQCSIRSCEPDSQDAVLNIGTSSQLSFIIKKDHLKDYNGFRKLYPALDIVPYLHDEIIVTAASLTALGINGRVIETDFIAVICQAEMREFGGYQIQSIDYRLLYEQAVQENEQLKHRNSRQKLEISSLKKQLSTANEQLQSKDAKSEQLESELYVQKQNTDGLKEELEIQQLKTERAHERRMEAEKKFVKLEKIAEKMKKEIVKADCARTILKSQMAGLGKRVAEQNIVFEQHMIENEKLVAKVADLTDLCKRANKRIDADAVATAELQEKLNKQGASLDLSNKFCSSVREREVKIHSCIEKIIHHYEGKFNNRCFFKRKPKSSAYDIVQELAAIVGKEDNVNDTLTDDPGRQLM